MNDNKKWIRKLFALLLPYVKELLIILMLLLISSGLNLCIPLLNKDILDRGFAEQNYSLLCKLVILTFGFQLINTLCRFISERHRLNISNKIQFSLQEKSFLHIMKLENSYFENKNTTELLGRIDTDIQYMRSIAESGFLSIVSQGIMVIGGIVGLLIIDYRLTIIVLLFVPAKICIVNFFMKKRKQNSEEFLISSSRFAGWFGDCVNGVKEVKLFQLVCNKKKEFEQLFRDVVSLDKKMCMLSLYNQLSDQGMTYLLVLFIYLVGGRLVNNHTLTLGGVVTFLTYSNYVTGPITYILNIGFNLSSTLPSTKRFYEFMSENEEDYEGVDLNFDEVTSIAFHDISFSYDKEKISQKQLNDVTFEVYGNSKIGIIGKNGAGKSTLLNLLLRFSSPDSGEITINNSSITKYKLNHYRSLFAVVSQQVYLFHSTIRNNVCLFKNHPDEKVIEVLEQCGMGTFVKEYGLDYVVGDNGSMLSGGQKQKIALARALILNRPILIFDEATSNVDTYMENKLKELLHNELKDKMVFIISHKKDILKEMDTILLMIDGKLECQGTLQELSSVSKNFQKYIESFPT